MFYIKTFYVSGGRIKYATCVCSATKLPRKCKRFSKLCLYVPRFPCGISCSTRPFYKLAFFKREIFLGCFFNKREEQTSNVSWSISGVFHGWGGNPSSQNSQGWKSPGIPLAPPQSCHLNLVPRCHIQAPAFHPANSAPTWAQGLGEDPFLQDL